MRISCEINARPSKFQSTHQMAADTHQPRYAVTLISDMIYLMTILGTWGGNCRYYRDPFNMQPQIRDQALQP